jgi:tetratricopeptide (TPR) repeat protein
MGKDLRRTAEWRKAERAYNQLHASSVQSLKGIGPVLKSWEEIDWELEEILEECPEYFPALFQRAEFMFRTGRSADGEEFFDKAFIYLVEIIRNAQEFRIIFSQRVENLEKLLRYDLAVQYLEKAIQLFTDIAAFYDYLAFYMLQLPGYKKSRVLQLQEKALDIDPDNDTFINNLGWIHLMIGNYKEAEKLIQKAIEFNPENPNATENLDTVEYMQKHGLTYHNYLLRPVDKEILDKFLKTGAFEELTALCRTYNNDRLEAFKIHHMQKNSLQPHEILDILQPFKTFMNAIEDVVGDEIFLYECIDLLLLKEARYYFYQFIVRYDNINGEYIREVCRSISVIYAFLLEVKLVTPSKYDRLMEHIKPLNHEFSSRIEEYNKVRYNVALAEEEKEAIIEKLFGL